MTLPRYPVRLLLAVVVTASALACAWAAAAELDSRREWDERHSMDNVKSILTTGSLRPVFPLYPSLAYLPHAAAVAGARAVMRVAGREPGPVVTPEGDAAPHLYLVGRWLCVAWGALTLLATWSVGRRLFTPATGLLAALLLAASPWFVRAVTVFKPDPQLMLLTVVIFWWSLRAAERGTLGRYLLAGAGVGLAAATKQTGALACLPLVAATALDPARRHRWLGLAAAGGVSVAVFLALNPFPDLLPGYLEIGGKYVRWAAATGESQPHTLLFLPGLLVSTGWHGPVVGTAALVALLALLWLPVSIWRARGDRCRHTGLALFAALVFGFPLACSAVSGFPKTNVFLPLLPFTSLAAARALMAAWRTLARRLPAAWLRPAGVGATLALLAAILGPPSEYVYQRAVPRTTLTTAADLITSRAPGLAHRAVVYEAGAGELAIERRWTRRSGVAVWTVERERLADLPHEGLDLADYEVFREERLHGPESEFYMRRLTAATPDRIWFIDPDFVRRRGRRQVVVAHPWTVLPPALPVDWGRAGRRATRLRAPLPEVLAPGGVISLDLRLTDRQARDCRLSLGRQPLKLRLYAWEGREKRWMTRRFPLRSPQAPLLLECPDAGALRPRPRAAMWRWADG